MDHSDGEMIKIEISTLKLQILIEVFFSCYSIYLIFDGRFKRNFFLAK